jgi:hypothetical protein
VAQEIGAGRLPPECKQVAAQAQRDGRHVVTVYAAYGAGQAAVRIMDSCSPVEDERLPESFGDNAEPRLMSEAYGIPLLTKRRFFTISETQGLSKFRFVLGNFFGLPLTSKKAAPLSSATGMKVLKERPKSWTKSMGMPLLSSKGPAPLSSAVGMKTVVGRKKQWTSSMGLPLQSKSAAPFSEALGFPVLTQKKR